MRKQIKSLQEKYALLKEAMPYYDLPDTPVIVNDIINSSNKMEALRKFQEIRDKFRDISAKGSLGWSSRSSEENIQSLRSNEFIQVWNTVKGKLGENSPRYRSHREIDKKNSADLLMAAILSVTLGVRNHSDPFVPTPQIADYLDSKFAIKAQQQHTKTHGVDLSDL